MVNRKNGMYWLVIAGLVVSHSLPLQASSKDLLMRRRSTAAKTAETEDKKKEPWQQVKDKVLTPIGATYLYEQVEGLVNAARDAFKGASDKLNGIANLLDTLPTELQKKLADVFHAPEKLREGAQQIETKFIKQINNTLVTVKEQRQKIVELDLQSKPIVELRQLEPLLMTAFSELEKFLQILLGSLTEIKDALNQTADPVAYHVQTIRNNLADLGSRINKAELGYPGLPARLRAIATILNP